MARPPSDLPTEPATEAPTQPPTRAPHRGPLEAKPTRDGKIRVALLDGTGRLIGYETRDDWQDGDDGLPVPGDTDLAPRRYRYDIINKRFDPIAAEQEEQEKIMAPDALRAICLGLIAVRDDGRILLPQHTLDYLQFWETSIDAK